MIKEMRRIIKIDEDKCDGCGICVDACHEAAIAMIDGKARLTRDDYCDGLGDCLPTCPTGAISFEEREALPFDKEAVLANMAKAKEEKERMESQSSTPCGCPGSSAKSIERPAPQENLPCGCSGTNVKSIERNNYADEKIAGPDSQLGQWPVQIKLVPVQAPYFNGAKLLIAADCTAFAYGDFHNRFIKDHITIIGCPKLDMLDYSEKLTEIIKNNDIKKMTVVRMEVPCCGGIEHAAKKALENSGKFIPWQIVTISTDGRILDE